MATIVILATGGTIAGRASTSGNAVAYQAGQITAEDLLQNVAGLPSLLGETQLRLEQIAQIDSKDMDFAVWQQLAQRSAYWLAQEEVWAVIITHGTDTLEETAFFLQQALACAPQAQLWQNKAVVLTCAMRPASARMADGPQNLADAIALAQDAQARGVLVVTSGQVHAANYVQKIHPYRLDAFSSSDVGILAYMEESQARWLHALPRAPNSWPQAPSPQDAEKLWQAIIDTAAEQWPWVEIVQSGTGASERTLNALSQAGVRGFVISATGNGTVHQQLQTAAQRLISQGTPCLLSTRCTASSMVRSADSPADTIAPARLNAFAHLPIASEAKQSHTAAAQFVLPAGKARVLLILHLLAKGERTKG